jgi:hypothetical protein
MTPRLFGALLLTVAVIGIAAVVRDAQPPAESTHDRAAAARKAGL